MKTDRKAIARNVIRGLRRGSATLLAAAFLTGELPQTCGAADTDGDGVSDEVELADGTAADNGSDWKPFSKGLLLCYPFEGNANDTSGNGGNATLYGSPAFAEGVRGRAVSFDGVNDHLARTPVPVTSNPFTYSIWIRMPSNKPYNTWVTVFEQGQSYQYSPILTARVVDATHFEFGGYTWTGGYSSIGSSAISCADPYAWHHLVWTSTPEGNRKLYFDGAVAASTTGQAFGEQNSWLRLGGNIAENQYQPYQADEFRVYNRGLPDSEVAAMYANQAPVPSDNADLSGLQPGVGSLVPAFSAPVAAYVVEVPFATAAIAVTPTAAHPKAVVDVRMNEGGYLRVASGATSQQLPLNPGSNALEVRVTAENGTPRTYTVSVRRRSPLIQVSDGPVVLTDENGEPLDFGRGTREKPSVRSLTITNAGTDDLTLGEVTVTGAGAFAASRPAVGTLAPGASTYLTVTFGPDSGGVSFAAIQIASNTPGPANPFDLTCTGSGLGYSDDTDGDGLNDAAEFNMAALGFDFQTSQPALVEALLTGANSAGLFQTSQIQGLHVGSPLIARDPVSGAFRLTLGLEKSADLNTYQPFPLTPSQVSINAGGRLEIRFDPADGTAFFRVGAN